MEEVKFNFENLIVYQKSLDFIDLVYDTSEKFPKMITSLQKHLKNKPSNH